MNSFPSCGLCILAGGLSSRMGRDKARLRLGSRTVLGHIRATAGAMGLPVRVLRRDRVPRCGPLGGIFTALTTRAHEMELFLACDMPFVSRALLEKLLAALSKRKGAVFVAENGVAGFPCLLRRGVLPVVGEQIARGQLSLQALADVLKARLIPPAQPQDLFNVNTPEHWAEARRLWRERRNQSAPAAEK